MGDYIQVNEVEVEFANMQIFDTSPTPILAFAKSFQKLITT